MGKKTQLLKGEAECMNKNIVAYVLLICYDMRVFSLYLSKALK